MYPILDQEQFLSVRDFDIIKEACPIEGWQEAVVYNRSLKKDVTSHDFRKAYKTPETRKHIQKTFKNIITKTLLPWLRTQPHFQHLWVRPFTEWLRYEEGMFFQKHQDFERYVCNGMVPYVCLIGLQDTENGGETVVGEQVCRGSCRQNGVVFFPSNIPHQAKKVVKGVKVCLKMEIQVFFSPEDGFIRVSDKDNQWLSFWSKKELELVDNYICSHHHFTDRTTIETSTDMAKDIHNMMIRIAEPMSKVPVAEEAQDMIFPTRTIAFLHDIFSYHHFSQAPDQRVFFGSDAKAWDYMNKEMELPPHHTLLVGLWYKEEKDEPYRLSSLCDRAGNEISMAFPTTVKEMNKYADYDTLCANLLQDFTNHKDISSSSSSFSFMFRPPLTEKDGRRTPSVRKNWRPLIKSYKPSDQVKYIKRSGVQVETVSEMCNDEHGYSETGTYSRYVSYSIHIRWLVYSGSE
jgi:hypothetical protein